jgi:hypothetical protein
MAKKTDSRWFQYTPSENGPHGEAQNAHLGIVTPGETYEVPAQLAATFAASGDWTRCDAPE